MVSELEQSITNPRLCRWRQHLLGSTSTPLRVEDTGSMNAENKGTQTLKERWLYILKAESLSFQKAGALQVNLSASSWFSFFVSNLQSGHRATFKCTGRG